MEHAQVEKVEVWNLGCTFFHLVVGGDPWHHYEKAVGVHYPTNIGLYRDLIGKPSSQVVTEVGKHHSC
eukprot:scaffold179878_cov29-Prasinocladus_malaysianus.AAC.3